MKNQEPEDEEARRKRIRYERDLARSKYFTKKTDLSFPICEWIVKQVLIEKQLGDYVLNKRVDEMLTPYLVEETIIRIEKNSLPSVGCYDSGFEMNPGEEPPACSMDLWSAEKINVEKYIPQFIIKKSSVLSNTGHLSVSNAKSVRSKQVSAAQLPKEETTTSKQSYFPPTIKQHPIGTQTPREYENEDNQLRKYMQRKQEISEALKMHKRGAQTSRKYNSNVRGFRDKILTGLAIDSNGKIMKRK